MANMRLSEIDKILHDSEVAGEKVAAVFRFVIFLALVIVVLSMQEHGGHFPQLATATGIYGLGSIIGFLLAWRRIFHPLIPYIFVTFDIVILVVEVILLGKEMNLPPVLTFALPVSSLVFVLLIHASMRYRPWLVVYGAILFIAMMQIGVFIASMDGEYPSRDDLMKEHFGVGGFMHYEAFPVMLVGLCAIFLYVIGNRTRNLLLASIEHGQQVSRLSRYFSPKLADELAASRGKSVFGGTRQSVSVIFVDIRNFSNLAETMEPYELSEFLSEFRRRMVEPVFTEGGTVDKFIGDALMVVFGTPKQRRDDAVRALNCALEMIDTIEAWSSERSQRGEAPLSIGIGIHYGEVFAGNIGNDRLLEYTVIGDTVNIAKRLEKLTRKFDTPIIVSEAFLSAARTTNDSDVWERLPYQNLPGHSQPIDVYRYKSGDPSVRVNES